MFVANHLTTEGSERPACAFARPFAFGAAERPRSLTIQAPRLASPLSAFRFPLCLLLLFSAFATSGCGYTVGSPYRAEIRSVYVPTFTSNSNRRWLEYQLTESVQKQIQSRTHFRLASEGDADSKLIGRIVDANKRVLGQTNNSDPRELQMNLQVEVTWEDARTGEVLRQENIPINPDMVRLAAQSELAPEIGQSMATATREVVDRLARNIVDMMEAGW